MPIRRSPLVVPTVVLLSFVQTAPRGSLAQTVVGKAPPSAISVVPIAERTAFESGLTMGPLQMPLIRESLAWRTYPGAASYRILRSQSATTAPVAVATIQGAQYTAHILPSNSFVFRVVALAANGQGLDTTKSVSFTTTAGAAFTQLPATCATNNGTFTLGWNAIVNADDYSVVIVVPGTRGPHGGVSQPAYLANTNVTTTSFSATATSQARTYNVGLSANYTLHDYPTAGQVTRVIAEVVQFNVVDPWFAAGPCSNSAGKVNATLPPPQ